MSPIEHLWDILDRRVSSRVPPPNTIAQMQEALREEWEAIPQQDIRRLVHSMRRRITALYPSQRWPHTILIMLIVLCNPEVAWYSIFLLFICLCV